MASKCAGTWVWPSRLCSLSGSGALDLVRKMARTRAYAPPNDDLLDFVVRAPTAAVLVGCSGAREETSHVPGGSPYLTFVKNWSNMFSPSGRRTATAGHSTGLWGERERSGRQRSKTVARSLRSKMVTSRLCDRARFAVQDSSGVAGVGVATEVKRLLGKGEGDLLFDNEVERSRRLRITCADLFPVAFAVYSRPDFVLNGTGGAMEAVGALVKAKHSDTAIFKVANFVSSRAGVTASSTAVDAGRDVSGGHAVTVLVSIAAS